MTRYTAFALVILMTTFLNHASLADDAPPPSHNTGRDTPAKTGGNTKSRTQKGANSKEKTDDRIKSSFWQVGPEIKLKTAVEVSLSPKAKQEIQKQITDLVKKPIPVSFDKNLQYPSLGKGLQFTKDGETMVTHGSFRAMPDQELKDLKGLVGKLSGLPQTFYLNEFPKGERPAFGSPQNIVKEDYDHLFIEQGTGSDAKTIGVFYFSNPPEVRLLPNVDTEAK